MAQGKILMQKIGDNMSWQLAIELNYVHFIYNAQLAVCHVENLSWVVQTLIHHPKSSIKVTPEFPRQSYN